MTTVDDARRAALARIARMQGAPRVPEPDAGVVRLLLAMRRHETWGAQRDHRKLDKARPGGRF